jgi:hypothetical protein
MIAIIVALLYLVNKDFWWPPQKNSLTEQWVRFCLQALKYGFEIGQKEAMNSFLVVG